MTAFVLGVSRIQYLFERRKHSAEARMYLFERRKPSEKVVCQMLVSGPGDEKGSSPRIG